MADDGAECLEGLEPAGGGLTVYDDKRSTAKKSESSRYGLDELAKMKRLEREEKRADVGEDLGRASASPRKPSRPRVDEPKGSTGRRSPSSRSPSARNRSSAEDRDKFAVPPPRKPSWSSGPRHDKRFRDRESTPQATPGRSSFHSRSDVDRAAIKTRTEQERYRHWANKGIEYRSSRFDSDRRSTGRLSRFSDQTPSERRGDRTPSRLGWDGRSTPKRSSWDATPSREATRSHPSGRTPHIRESPMTERLPSFHADDGAEPGTEITEEELKAYELEEERLEREWYLQDDEYGNVYDPTGTEDAGRPVGGGDGDRDEELAKKQAKRLSARAAQLHEDANRWEEHQMKLGGVRGPMKELSMDFNEDSGPRIAVLVKETVPPFLEGKLAETTTADTVVPIKDPTSDMAVVARKGSDLVRQQREQRERTKSRTKYWELGKETVGAKQKSAEEESKEKEQMEQSLLQMRADGTNDADDDSGRKSMQYASTFKSAEDRSVAAMEAIQKQRRSLPVYTVRDKLLQVIRDNQVVIIVGETGSGKTTQLTQYLLEEGYGRGGIIGCTQPRRVAAVSVAKRVAEEMSVELGTTVGYAIRFEDFTSKETRVKYMTDGILLRETLSDPELDAYSCVVMDEAHERSLNTDVLFGVLRKIVTRRRDLKVIVTSATMNADRFADFFGRAPIFNIPGRTFPVEVFFAKHSMEDYVDSAVRQVLQIHLQAPLPGDILVFMTGQEDIEVTCEVLAARMEMMENPPPLLILPIYSQLAADMQARIFDPAPEGERKVIVATNIAETSLTVDGVSFVVDSGFCKLKVYNPRIGMDALLLCPTSRASANQRSGRAGRTGPGKTYRLYPAEAFANEMLESSVPEIQRTNLGHVVLLLKSLGVKDLLDFDFMDPPPQENIVKSMLGLWMLGALDSSGELTDLGEAWRNERIQDLWTGEDPSKGRRMSTFPLDPALSRMLLAGEVEGCSQEVVTIVAMLSVPSVFYRPREREEEADLAREKFFVPESDHLTLLHVYQRWRSGGSRADWCTKHFLNSKGLRRAKEVRSQLLDVMKDEKVQLNTCGTDWDSIRKAVTSAYFHQAARMKGLGEYMNMRSGVVCAVHPTSALYGAGLTADYVVYHELIYTQKEYMSCVTSVEPQWLAQMGPMFFTMRSSSGAVPVTVVGDGQESEGVQTTPGNSDRPAFESDWGVRLVASRKRAKSRGMITPGRPDKVPRTPGRLGL